MLSLYFILVGYYTEQGYELKKKKLEENEVDPLYSVQCDSKNLSSMPQEPLMSETIAKLFRKPPSTSTSLSLSKPTKATSSKGKSSLKLPKPV